MAYFIITGKMNCLNTAHAIHVAEYLKKSLPSFRYHSIIKSEEDWPTWLDQLNSVNNWHETRSPVIWKEINIMGGKAYLIGGLGEFWEYCYDYYGFQSRMSKEDLEKIMADNMLTKSSEVQKYMTISILGAADNYMMTQYIVYELQNCSKIESFENMIIKLFDKKFDKDPEEEEELLGVIDDYKNMINGIPHGIVVVTSEVEAIENCDLLIIIDDYSRASNETFDAWLRRCRKNMLVLSDDLNMYAKRDLRIILCQFGPVCFNASLLMEYCSTINIHNIVAVTADEGISLISMMSEKSGEPVEHFWCPAVWGFSGIMSFVNLTGAALTSQVYRPYKRALTSKESSSLPKGEFQDEIRFLRFLIRIDDALYEEIKDKKAEEKKILGREVFLPKIRALASLLRLWFADEISDDIIALGICSDGSFGCPKGVCFSQAVILNEKRIWEPFHKLPLRSDTENKISAISLHIENTLKKYELGERFNEQNNVD